MSKHLAKILSICALVVIFPLAILGITLALTNPNAGSTPAPDQGTTPAPTEITYVVNYHALDNSATNQLELDYSEENGFEAYTKERSGYMFVGIDLAGTTYVYNKDSKDYVSTLGNKLSDAIASTQNPTLTAVWDSIYPNVYITFNALDSNDMAVKGKKGGSLEFEWLEKESYHCNFMDEVGDNYFDLADNAYNFFTDGYTNIQDQDGNAVKFNGVIDFAIEGKTGAKTYMINEANTESLTFELIMSKFCSEDYYRADMAEDVEVILTFYFEIQPQ